MDQSSHAVSHSSRRSEGWVESLGGPLIVVPVSVLAQWGGCSENWGEVPGSLEDYDRACAVEDLAGLLNVGSTGAQALVLADEPAPSRYLPEQRVFVRWRAANSEDQLLAAAQAVLADDNAEWEDVGVWETDGPAVLMDSTTAGLELNEEYPDGGRPAQAPVTLPAGRWRVRAIHTTGEFPWVGVVQLLPMERAE
ncbi:Imm21 family immunity protein [Streptomyces sp. NPDC007172]|uniref:Imm21 family immunity protein n=1 Tax=Streptomyces sp. NPDC007172 TaxID=3364776 RepID=UPI0036A66AB6